MKLNYLEQKRLEYQDIGPAPECDQLDSYENRIYILKKAISLALKPIKGKKQSIVDAIQRNILDVLEPELLAIQENPEYLRLREERNKALLDAEQTKSDEMMRKLYDETVKKASQIVSNTPIDAGIEDIDINAFDLFYKDRYLNAISKTGSVSYPGTTKDPKKIVVKNIDALRKIDFIRSSVAPKHGEGLVSGQYQSFLERGYILGTVYVGAPLNHYFALHFDCREESIGEAIGTVELTPLSLYAKIEMKPDIKIEHTAYIENKRKKYGYK